MEFSIRFSGSDLAGIAAGRAGSFPPIGQALVREGPNPISEWPGSGIGAPLYVHHRLRASCHPNLERINRQTVA